MNLTKLIFVIMILLLTANVFAYIFPGQLYSNIQGNGLKLIGGEGDDSTVSYSGKFLAGYYLSRNFGIDISGGYGFVEVRDKKQFLELFSHLLEIKDSPYRTHIYPISLNGRINLLTNKKWIPYIRVGLGALVWNVKKYDTNQMEGVNFSSNIGGGVEFEFTRNVGINFSFQYDHLFNQKDDMSGYGDIQSGALTFGVGLAFRLGGSKDSDRDGINDRNDKCPYKKEDFDGFEDEDGCPDFDNDGDLLLDTVETNTGIFVDLKDTGTNSMVADSDEDGLNDFVEIDKYKTDPNVKDTDGDGLTDGDEITIFKTDPNQKDTDSDKLEDSAEINDFETNPLKADSDGDGWDDFVEINDHKTDPLNADSDGDGIIDSEDKCPNEAENINGYLDKDGCVDEKPEIIFTEKAPIVLKEVRFKSGSAELTEQAMGTLDKVIKTLKNYPEMQLKISGHTDNTGTRALNLRLSKQRAESVRRYLVNNGIQEYRLSAEGLGPDHPVTSNKTKEGRSSNRRIEFFRTK